MDSFARSASILAMVKKMEERRAREASAKARASAAASSCPREVTAASRADSRASKAPAIEEPSAKRKKMEKEYQSGKCRVAEKRKSMAVEEMPGATVKVLLQKSKLRADASLVKPTKPAGDLVESARGSKEIGRVEARKMVPVTATWGTVSSTKRIASREGQPIRKKAEHRVEDVNLDLLVKKITRSSEVLQKEVVASDQEVVVRIDSDLAAGGSKGERDMVPEDLGVPPSVAEQGKASGAPSSATRERESEKQKVATEGTSGATSSEGEYDCFDDNSSEGDITTHVIDKGKLRAVEFEYDDAGEIIGYTENAPVQSMVPPPSDGEGTGSVAPDSTPEEGVVREKGPAIEVTAEGGETIGEVITEPYQSLLATESTSGGGEASGVPDATTRNGDIREEGLSMQHVSIPPPGTTRPITVAEGVNPVEPVVRVLPNAGVGTLQTRTLLSTDDPTRIMQMDEFQEVIRAVIRNDLTGGWALDAYMANLIDVIAKFKEAHTFVGKMNEVLHNQKGKLEELSKMEPEVALLGAMKPAVNKVIEDVRRVRVHLDDVEGATTQLEGHVIALKDDVSKVEKEATWVYNEVFKLSEELEKFKTEQRLTQSAMHGRLSSLEELRRLDKEVRGTGITSAEANIYRREGFQMCVMMLAVRGYFPRSLFEDPSFMDMVPHRNALYITVAQSDLNY